MLPYRLRRRINDWQWQLRVLGAKATGGIDETFRTALKSRRGGGTPFRQILFVCSGNICRSPYGELKLRQLIAQDTSSTGNITVLSCGSDTTPGKPADPTALAVASERGVDLGSHRTTSLSAELARSSDLILAMDLHHLEAVTRLEPDAQNRAMLLGAMLLPARRTPIIADPFGLPPAEFRCCFDLIDSSLAKLVEEGLFS